MAVIVLLVAVFALLLFGCVWFCTGSTKIGLWCTVGFAAILLIGILTIALLNGDPARPDSTTVTPKPTQVGE